MKNTKWAEMSDGSLKEGKTENPDLKVRFRIARYSWQSYCQHYHLEWLKIQKIESFSTIPR